MFRECGSPHSGNVEDGWNNFRKIICKIANGALGKKVRRAARNISEKALCLTRWHNLIKVRLTISK